MASLIVSGSPSSVPSSPFARAASAARAASRARSKSLMTMALSRRVELLDPLEVQVEQLDRRHLPRSRSARSIPVAEVNPSTASLISPTSGQHHRAHGSGARPGAVSGATKHERAPVCAKHDRALSRSRAAAGTRRSPPPAAPANRIVVRSSRYGPIAWMPTGSPSALSPTGNAVAGWPRQDGEPRVGELRGEADRLTVDLRHAVARRDGRVGRRGHHGDRREHDVPLAEERPPASPGTFPAGRARRCSPGPSTQTHRRGPRRRCRRPRGSWRRAPGSPLVGVDWRSPSAGSEYRS